MFNKKEKEMWEDNISVEVAISIMNWDKESSWNKLLKDYFGGETNGDSRQEHN